MHKYIYIYGGFQKLGGPNIDPRTVGLLKSGQLSQEMEPSICIHVYHAYMHIHIHIYIHVYTCYICIYIHVCTYVCIYRVLPHAHTQHKFGYFEPLAVGACFPCSLARDVGTSEDCHDHPQQHAVGSPCYDQDADHNQDTSSHLALKGPQ